MQKSPSTIFKEEKNTKMIKPLKNCWKKIIFLKNKQRLGIYNFIFKICTRYYSFTPLTS